MPIRSPGVSSCLSAVSRSSATSPERSGMRPSTFETGLNGFGEAVEMIVPPPPVERLSSPSITSAPGAHRSPWTLATPGTARMSSISVSWSGRAALNWLENEAFGATSTSTPE
jgi:hypothetical protein